MIARKLRVRGRVQGVGFRASMHREVLSIGEIRGYVRNLPDGSVEAVLVGPREKVEAAIEWCRQGPPYARVDQLDIQEIPESYEFQGFEVRR